MDDASNGGGGGRTPPTPSSEVLAAQKAWRLEKRRELELRNKKKLARQSVVDHPYAPSPQQQHQQAAAAVAAPPAKRLKAYPVAPGPFTEYARDSAFQYVVDFGAPPVTMTQAAQHQQMPGDDHARTVEAQRQWKAQKLRELAEKRAKGTPSKRGRRKSGREALLAPQPPATVGAFPSHPMVYTSVPLRMSHALPPPHSTAEIVAYARHTLAHASPYASAAMYEQAATTVQQPSVSMAHATHSAADHHLVSTGDPLVTSHADDDAVANVAAAAHDAAAAAAVAHDAAAVVVGADGAATSVAATTVDASETQRDVSDDQHVEQTTTSTTVGASTTDEKEGTTDTNGLSRVEAIYEHRSAEALSSYSSGMQRAANFQIDPADDLIGSAAAWQNLDQH